MALSKVDLANQVENILPETLGGTGASQFPAQFRNIIINGDMSIAQRGTSTSGVTTTDGYYACDRFYTRTDTGTWTISQSTDVPTGQGFANSFKLDCTSAGTSNADEVIIRYNSEGQFLQYLKYGTSNAESLTCSFWIKSNKTGAYSLNINNNNTSQIRLISFAYNIDSADTWEKKIITLPGDTVRSINNSNTQDFQAQWIFGAASSFTSGGVSNTWIDYAANRSAPSDLAGLGGSTSDYVNITGVQLEAGTTASDFEFLPVDVNLGRCQRYFYMHANTNADEIGIGGYYSSSQIFCDFQFPVSMRTTPSVYITTGTNYFRIFRNGAIDSFNSLTFGAGNVNMFSLYNNTEVSGTAGHAGFVRPENSSAVIGADAEL